MVKPHRFLKPVRFCLKINALASNSTRAKGASASVGTYFLLTKFRPSFFDVYDLLAIQQSQLTHQ